MGHQLLPHFNHAQGAGRHLGVPPSIRGLARTPTHMHPRTCTQGHKTARRNQKGHAKASIRLGLPVPPAARASLFVHLCNSTAHHAGGRRGRMLTVNRLGSRNAPLGAARLQSWVMVAVGDLDGRTQVHKATSRPPHAPALIHPLDPPTHPPTRLRPCTHKQAPWPQQRAKASAVVVDGGEPGRCERVACPP